MGNLADRKNAVGDVCLFRKVCSYLGSKTPSRSLSLLLILLPAVLISGSMRLDAQGPNKRVIKRNATSKFTGSDGSETGTADFGGNFTFISAPAGQALVLFRQPDCSLSLGTGSYNVGQGTYSEVGLVTDYERTLHTEAGLTTTPDVFSKPCAQYPAPGLNANPMVFVGNTTKGVGVFATIGVGAMGNESLYIAAGTSTFKLSNFAFAAAGVIATADLNGDGNGDLVITDNSLNSGGGAVTVMLGNDDGTFQTGVTYPTTGTGTDSVVIDDFNGDGKLDLAAVSDTAQGQQISILLGKGDGTFAAAQSFAAPTIPGYATSTPSSGLISGDFRNSGKKDIILSNGTELLGNGDGTFTAATASAFPYFQTGSGTNLASGDVNNDGKLDVVVSLGTSVLIYTGKGDGTFTPGNSYLTDGAVGYVAVDDLDGDGNQDIYIGLGDGGVYVGDVYDPNLSYALMGHGDGTFAGAPAIPPGAGLSNTAISGYNGTNLGDVNGDGYPDLIVPGTSTSYNVLLGSSAGTYDIASSIQIPASITIYGHTINTAGALTNNTAVADVNGDGKADLIFVDNMLNPYMADGSTALNPLPVYFVALSNGDGTFKTPVAYPFPSVAASPNYDNNLQVSSPVIANITSGGHGDLVMGFNDVVGGASVANPYLGGFLVLAGNGDGTFSTTATLTTTSSSNTAPATALLPTVNAMVDLNGDKKLDLVTITNTFSAATGSSTQLQELAGNGDGTFQAPSNINVFSTGVQSSTYSLVFADFNADGKLDLACLNETYTDSNAQLAIALGNGDGTFQAPSVFNLSGGDVIRGTGISTADFNGDGKLDLALLSTANLSGIFYGNGDGTFVSVPDNGNIYPKDLVNLSLNGPSIALDLNKDGKPDILSGNGVLLNVYGATTGTTPASSTTTLKASAASVTAGTSVTFTATVAGGSGSSGTPTGTVNFLDGTTTLGTGTLSSGVATYTTSSLAVGSHSVTAKYGGDTNFTSSTSSAVTVTVTAAVPPSFTLGASPTSVSISAAGSTGTTTLTVTPAGGFNQPVSFACSGLPSEASCTFAPATVTPTTAAVTTTLTISTTAAHVMKGAGSDHSALKRFGTLASFALLFLTFRPVRNRSRWLLILVTLSAGAALMGCGGGSNGSGGGGGGGGGGGTTDPGTPSGTSTVTVTATAGSLTQTVTLTVAVQ